MVGLPINIPIPQETAIASYDYFDIADGTGVIDFDLFRANINSTVGDSIFGLTRNGSYSNPTYTGVVAATNYDFKVTFSSPRYCKGTAFVDLSIRLSAAGACTSTPTVKLVHLSGITETDMSSAISGVAATSAGATTYSNIFIQVEITTPKLFKIGDTLILRCTFVNTGGSVVSQLVHDPSGSDPLFTTTGGKSNAYIPFKLDL